MTKHPAGNDNEIGRCLSYQTIVARLSRQERVTCLRTSAWEATNKQEDIQVVNPIKINFSRLAVKTAYEVTGSRRGRRKFGKHETEEFGERGDRSETKEFGERSGSTGAFGKRFPRKSPNTFFQRDVYFFF